MVLPVCQIFAVKANFHSVSEADEPLGLGSGQDIYQVFFFSFFFSPAVYVSMQRRKYFIEIWPSEWWYIAYSEATLMNIKYRLR